MTYWYTLFPILIATTAAIAVRHGFIPQLGSFPAWATNLTGGAIAGGLVGGLARLGWRRLAEGLAEEGAETRLVNMLVLAAGGALVGAVLAAAVGLAFSQGTAVRVAEGCLLGGGLVAGLSVGSVLKEPLLSSVRVGGKGGPSSRRRGTSLRKVLDTSVIIDGRIGDLLRTGFLEGEILVPEFILAELQSVADSPNSLRRRKGRRGLEVLRELMQDEHVEIRVSSTDYPDIKEVDRKLLRMAKEQGAVLVTIDYNLNRVAQVEGVKILNVNELANAVKPRFIPGEELSVEVIDRGEEIGQGVGYLDDGTMVVVENGRRHIGRTIRATVKSALQTEAGRMLFVEPTGETAARCEKQAT